MYHYKLKAIFIIVAFLFASPFFVIAQNNDECKSTEDRRALRNYNRAMQALRNHQSSLAVDYLKKALDRDEEYADAIWRLAQIYYNKRVVKLAEKYLNQLVELCPDYNAEVYFMLANIDYGRDDYTNAIKNLETFLEDIDKIKRDSDYDDAVHMLDQARFLERILGHKVPFEPRKVQDISTDDDEYLAIISPDGEIAFFTRRMKAEPSLSSISWTERYEEKFMIAKRKNSKFDKGSVMPPPFNMMGNEGGATITARNDFLYYTVCQDVVIDGYNYKNCDIYYSRFIHGTWTKLQILDSVNISQKHTWESQPSITSDGKTLYFASDREGGYGGTDIWVVRKDDNNKWGKPENLGPNINTPGNERTPFIHTDSQTLYFSSSNRTDHEGNIHYGHKGLGGYDIFYSRMKDGEWEKAVNIGYPINSEADDHSFFVSTDGRTGYFSSNKIDETGGYNLYAFDLYPEARPRKVLFIKGEVKDDNDFPVIDATVELRNVETMDVTPVEVDSLTGKYVATAIFENDFVLTVKKPDHIYQTRYIDIDSAFFDEPVNIDFDIEKIEQGRSYQIHDINFATNIYELNAPSMRILNEFLVFLHDHPNLHIGIHGHTDSIGDAFMNMELSERRAKSVYEYLIKNGISERRLRWKGFGETEPIADNSTEEGRAKNRRTEFIIIRR